MRIGKTLGSRDETTVRRHNYHHIDLLHSVQVLVGHVTHHLYRRERALGIKDNQIALRIGRSYHAVHSSLELAHKFRSRRIARHVPDPCICIAALYPETRIAPYCGPAAEKGLRAIERKFAGKIKADIVKETVDSVVLHSMRELHYRIIGKAVADIEIA